MQCQHILTWHLIVKHAQMKWHLLVSCPPTYSRTASFEPWSFSLRNSSNMAASSWRYSSARSSFFSSAWEISSSLLISFLFTPREYYNNQYPHNSRWKIKWQTYYNSVIFIQPLSTKNNEYWFIRNRSFLSPLH